MIYDMPPPAPVPALTAPAEGQQIKKRHRSHDRTPDRPHAPRRRWPWVIGGIILLESGTKCQIVQLEPQPLCIPLASEPPANN